MTSHELARLLLARRDNDVMIKVEVDNDPDETNDAALYDMHYLAAHGVVYDSSTDRIFITTETTYGANYDE
jgi:hypothetical protein